MIGGSDGCSGMTVPTVSALHSVTKNRDGIDVACVAPPASAWTTLRTFAATAADTVDWSVMPTVTGIVDLSGLVYPTALTGKTLTVNGQTHAFAAGQPTDMADCLAELNAWITDITFTAPGPGFALVLVKKTPGNLAISGNAAAVLGLTEATTGSWVALPTYNSSRPTAPGVEVCFPQTFSVGNAPTEVILRLWRLNPQYGGTAEIAREIRFSAADIATQPTHRIPFDGSHAFLSVAFVGGAGPTITGTAKIRVVYDGVLSDGIKVSSSPLDSDKRTRGDAPVALLGAAQNVTAAWADLGPEIATMGYSFLVVWLDLTIHDSQNVRIRALAKHTSAHADEFPLPIKAVDVSGPTYFTTVQPDYTEIGLDADQKVPPLIFPLYNCIPYVQIRVMAEVAGATPGCINTAYATYGFGGAS